MGIEEYILARAENKGIKKGLTKGRQEGVNLMIIALLKETDFTNERIAIMAGVSVEHVQKLREVGK